ncbi:hypothetical protein PHYPO_G00174760 [Pangasianodon hypophthalmus]|uniref:Uncharacterized protein n=1 Tax=Pangasianodon hypophthalmus TaxID=310915 RepID=A0A5N5PQQ0_PANHP|nr:hypothetical protein PHYPO_G00174760 [Pangasianodon hypophthalmus]
MADTYKSEERSAKPEKQEKDDSTDTEDVNTSSVQSKMSPSGPLHAKNHDRGIDAELGKERIHYCSLCGRSFTRKEYVMADTYKSEDSAKPEKRDEDSSTDTEDVNTSSVQSEMSSSGFHQAKNHHEDVR